MTEQEMQDFTARIRAENERSAKQGKEYFSALVPLLKEGGAAKLVVYYSGEGDSGQIEYIHTLANEDDDNADQQNITVPNLDEAKIDDAACNVLSGLDIDWYNNEGGYGFVVLTVSTGKITVEHNQRVEESIFNAYEL